MSCAAIAIEKQNARSLWNQTARLAGRLSGRLKQRLLDVLDAMRGATDIDLLETAISRGLVVQATAAFPWDVLEDRGRSTLEAGLSEAVDRALKVESGLGALAQTEISFSLEASGAIDWIEAQAAKRVVEITQETQGAIRGAVLDAFREGRPPATAAVRIRELVGVTQRIEQAAGRFERRLIATDVPEARRQRLVARYVERHRKLRARTIARTETIDGLAEGQVRAWQQAIDQGAVRADQVVEVWVTARDANVCPRCRQAAALGETRFGESFSGSIQLASGRQRPWTARRPPVHPSCRCRLVTRTLALAA